MDPSKPAAEAGTAIDAAVVTHDVICDECGVHPIVGTRYKASHIDDYDVCGGCIQDYSIQDKAKFVVFHEPEPKEQEEEDESASEHCINADSFFDAAELVGKNEAKKRYAYFHLDVENDLEEDSKLLQSALSSNTHLEKVCIHFCTDGFDSSSSQLVANVVHGISANTSIQVASLHLSDYNRNDVTAEAIRDMMTQNNTLKTLIVGLGCFDDEGELLHDDKVELHHDDERSERFAITIFQGLKTNSNLTFLQLSSYSVLCETTKETLLEVIQNNETIKYVVCTDFENENNNDQQQHDQQQKQDTYRLELLLQCNRRKWMKRMVEPDATKEEQVEVLIEALRCRYLLEPVSSAYHLLRSRPDLCNLATYNNY